MRFVMEGKHKAYKQCSHWINSLFILDKTFYLLLYHRIILEADPSAVVKRVDLRNDDIPIGEQTVAQVTNTLNGLFW